MSDQYFEGVVDTWVGDGKNFGFVKYEDSGRHHRVFFPANSIRLDAMGRRGHSTFVGALVRFKIDPVVHKGKSRTIAMDVHSVFSSDDGLSTSIEDHREVSEIFAITPGYRSVWLRREDGSPIFLHIDQVVPEHVDRFQDVRVGDYVYHGIQFKEAGKWAAVCAEIFSHEESEKLKRGESLGAEPQQPEPEPEPVVETVPEILAPENKSKTLLQLSLEKRVRHELSPQVETKP